MSNPFRIRVPSTTTTQSRGGRSLEEIEQQHKKERQQDNRNRRGFRGRRGRNREPVKKAPPPPRRIAIGQPGYFPIGGSEWAKEQAAKHPDIKFTSNMYDYIIICWNIISITGIK